MTEVEEPEEAAEIEPEWRQYERQIVETLSTMARDEAVVAFDQKLPGRLSGKLRQVDAVVTANFARTVLKDVTAVVDCKFYSRPVHVKHVEAFMGMVEDIGAPLGILITNIGFSPAAANRAAGGRGIELQVIPRASQPSVLIVDPKEPPAPYQPADNEAYYEAAFPGVDYDLDGLWTTISYYYVEESEYSYSPDDPPPEVMDTPIDGAPHNDLDWGTSAGRRRGATSVLKHYLGRTPNEDEISTFIEAIASEWESGYAWVLYDGDIWSRTGLWREGEQDTPPT